MKKRLGCILFAQLMDLNAYATSETGTRIDFSVYQEKIVLQEFSPETVGHIIIYSINDEPLVMKLPGMHYTNFYGAPENVLLQANLIPEFCDEIYLSCGLGLPSVDGNSYITDEHLKSINFKFMKVPVVYTQGSYKIDENISWDHLDTKKISLLCNINLDNVEIRTHKRGIEPVISLASKATSALKQPVQLTVDDMDTALKFCKLLNISKKDSSDDEVDELEKALSLSKTLNISKKESSDDDTDELEAAISLSKKLYEAESQRKINLALQEQRDAECARQLALSSEYTAKHPTEFSKSDALDDFFADIDPDAIEVSFNGQLILTGLAPVTNNELPVTAVKTEKQN
jgi:hypothetical protein